MVKKSLSVNVVEGEAFTPWGFTIHWGDVLDNYDKKYQLRDVVDKENYQRLLADPYIYNICGLATRLSLERFKIG